MKKLVRACAILTIMVAINAVAMDPPEEVLGVKSELAKVNHKINWTSVSFTLPMAQLYKSSVDNSYPLFKMRFSSIMANQAIEEKRVQMSKILALGVYQNAIQNVPAYKNFTNQNYYPKTWNDIPIMSKDNYVKLNPPKDRVFGGELPANVRWDTSSGSSGGEPTIWPRDQDEINAIQRKLEIALHLGLPDTKVTLINGFALGEWATGTTIAGISFADVEKINAGDNPQTWFKHIRVLAKTHSEKNHVFLLATYPPFLNKLVDYIEQHPDYQGKGGAKAFFDAYPVHAITGGEGIVEENRQRLKKYFKEIWSTYGASDLSVAIGGERDFERNLRLALSKDVELRKAFFGKERGMRDAPMVFHYDPLDFFIEEDQVTGHLLFTCMNHKLEARIRYDLQDIGSVMYYYEAINILKKHKYIGEKFQSPINLPLLFVWDRGENGVTFLGSNLYPANLIKLLETNNKIRSQVYRLAFHQYEKDGQNELDILVELQKGVHLSEPQKRRLHLKIIDGLKRINEDFKGIQDKQDRMPGIQFFAHEQSPMHKWLKPGFKNKYVFRGAFLP